MIEPHIYQAVVVAKALRLYARSNVRVNRAYTPSAMMRMAKRITGQKFSARDYIGAASALETWVQEHATN